jgi:hypothetical protein
MRSVPRLRSWLGDVERLRSTGEVRVLGNGKQVPDMTKEHGPPIATAYRPHCEWVFCLMADDRHPVTANPNRRRVLTLDGATRRFVSLAEEPEARAAGHLAPPD